MKIVIASLGRAHLLDCARELEKCGHDVVFFSATPKTNFKKFGLKQGGFSILPFVWPFYAIKRYFPSYRSQALYRWSQDFIVRLLLPKCDVFIAQSPNFRMSMRKAKKKYNSLTILDRGSTHVRSVNKIANIFHRKGEPEWYQKYDEAQYSMADYITVASDFVLQTFRENKFDINRLFVNPYGVSSSFFHPTVCTGEYDCIVVGQWSKRKGSDLVYEAFKDSNLKILHIGSLFDLQFPVATNFTHKDPVPEHKLLDYYSKARVFIFPSLEDGFGLVLLQAALCGLPIVCSQNCGGPTLKRILHNNENILVMDDFSPSTLKDCTNKALALSERQNGVRNYLQEDDDISWTSYGKRLDDFLRTHKRNG